MTDTKAILATLPPMLNAVADASKMLGASGAVPKYLALAAALVEIGVPAYNQLVELTNTVRTMVEDNREPTDEEWAALLSRSDAAHQTIQSAQIEDLSQ